MTPAAPTHRLARIDDLLRAGHTPDEIADQLQISLRSVLGLVSRLRKRNRDLFRRERAQERARAYQDCRRLQETLWEVITTLMAQDTPEIKTVPTAARAYLESVKAGEALRDAEDQHVQDGQLTVRDIYAQLGPGYLDDDADATAPTHPKSTNDAPHSDHAAPAGG